MLFNDYDSSVIVTASLDDGHKMNPTIEEMVMEHPYGSIVYSYINTYLYSAIISELGGEISEEKRRILSIIVGEGFLNNEVYERSLVNNIAYYSLNTLFGRVLSSVAPNEVLASLVKNLPYEMIADKAVTLHPFAYNDMRNASISAEVSSGGRK